MKTDGEGYGTPNPRITLEIVGNAPEGAQGTLHRAFTGEASPRQAIKAMCMVCVGFHRPSISSCTASACPLWEYRPFQKTGEP